MDRYDYFSSRLFGCCYDYLEENEQIEVRQEIQNYDNLRYMREEQEEQEEQYRRQYEEQEQDLDINPYK
jgi:hypothetical protein